MYNVKFLPMTFIYCHRASIKRKMITEVMKIVLAEDNPCVIITTTLLN
jgi:hypothetical protein